MGKMRFGARVVGEEKAAEQAKTRGVKSKVRYGDRVTGGAKAAKAKSKAPAKDPAKPSGQKAIPPLETEMSPEAFEVLLAEHAGQDGYLSIENLKTALNDAPSSFSRLLAWELNRADGARIGALQVLLQVETQRATGARDTVLSMLEGGLAAARGKTE